MKSFIVALLITVTTTAIPASAMNKDEAETVIARAEKMLELLDINRELSPFIPFDVYGEAMINIIFARNLIEEEKFIESYFYGAASIIRLETAEVVAKTRQARQQRLELERDYCTKRMEGGLASGVTTLLDANLLKKGPAFIATIFDERLFIQSRTRRALVISAEGRERLNHLAAVLKQFPGSRVTVAGHTEEFDGTDRSSNKAMVVADYLRRQGIAAARVNAAGLGNREPIATHRGYERVNRVEIIITGIK